MSLPTMSGVGRLTEDPELRFSASGVAVCSVSLAFNSRKLNRDTQQWEDDAVFFVRGKAFKDLAENVANSLSKGDEVQVSGRLKTERWQDKQTGQNRSSTELILDSIGPNLAYATATVQKLGRGADQSSPQSRAAGADDPWLQSPPARAAAGPADDNPPF